MDNLFYTLILITAIGCGLVAGIFLIFSNTVMSALGQLPPPQGIAAMQSINSTILNPLFFAVFFGPAALSILLGVSLFWRWNLPGSGFLLAGILLYLVGSIIVTIVFNVPMNESLDSVKAESLEGANMWAKYLVSWTAWNHVRTVASLLAAASYIRALG